VGHESSRRSSSGKAKRATAEVGRLAEALVAQWLIEQGWEVLQRRWHCRWGEIDLIAYSAAIAQTSSTQAALALIEVKARSRGNWDADGLLAVTPQKQERLWQTAQLFLSEHPHLVDLPCSFDVALVAYQPMPQPASTVQLASAAEAIAIPTPVEIGQPVAIAGYRLSLERYIRAAFD
jgi:putative endonuclease